MIESTSSIDQFKVRAERIVNSTRDLKFPFKTAGDREGKIADSLTSIFDLQVRSEIIGANFSDFIAMNLMFSDGSDELQAARSALIFNLFNKNPADALKIGKEWGFEPKDISSIKEMFLKVNQLIEKPTLTIEDVAELPSAIYALQGFVIQELTMIALSKKKVNPARLKKLSRIANLYFANANDRWKGLISPNAMCNAMVSCIDDIAFWNEYPNLFSIVSGVIRETTGVLPQDRYNYERFTHFAINKLSESKVIKKEDVKKGKIRVTGNIKPVYSALMDDLMDNDFNVSILGEEMNGDKSLIFLEDALKDRTLYEAQPLRNLIIKMLKFRWIGYDQRRCRVQVVESQLFDQIVNKINRQISEIRLGMIIGRLISKPNTAWFNVDDYLRISDYDGKSIQRSKQHKIPRNPAKIVLDHIVSTSKGSVRYAAYHSKKPLWIGAPFRRQPINFEMQVTLGKQGLETMNKIAALVLQADGDFHKAGLTERFINLVRDKALEEVQNINLYTER